MDSVEWVSFFFAALLLAIVSAFGASGTYAWLVRKWRERSRGATTSLYSNLNSRTLFIPDPVEDSEEENDHADVPDVNPFHEADRRFEEMMRGAMTRFETTQETMAQYRTQMEQMRRQQEAQSLRNQIQMARSVIPPVTMTFTDPPRLNPHECAHNWQEFTTQNGRTLRICGLCNATEEQGVQVLPPIPPCTRHTWNNPITMMNADNEPCRRFVCRDCGRTKTVKIQPMTIAEARLKKVRSIFLED